MITKESIQQAYERIKPYVKNTPVLTNDFINDLIGAEVFFKCENLQHIGAFKTRGAMNASLSLSKDELAKGVATHSSGNHAQALSRAAHMLGIEAHIVMPRTAPEIKKKGVRRYGGIIYECEPTLEARETTLAKVIAKTGATEIHPFNNEAVMAGQATAALEFFEFTTLDYLLTPVGGGGMLSGAALATHYFSSETIVIAGEPEGADDAFRSLKSGKIEPVTPNSIADGLLTTLGDKTFPVIHEYVKKVMTVSDQEIADAMRMLWEELKLIVEPSGAVPLAAVIKNKEEFAGKKVGIILSGGNVDLARAFKLMNIA
jgi:threonine dehydratase